ncbi:MAG: CRISPR-associated endonuclease Cas1 [Desulfonauticus sp.]|nr:CRISPR-associated endonuclease Cas1 [Desulfonauticus sp.]
MISLEPLYFLHCTFQVVESIHNLPYFTGQHWSGLLRDVYRGLFDESMPDTIAVIPYETGLSSILEGSRVSILLKVPAALLEQIKKVLLALPQFSHLKGHLVPQKRIVLEKVICALSQKELFLEEPETFQIKHVESAVQQLRQSKTITLMFYTPLRLSRPAGTKEKGHNFIDSDFLCNPLAGVIFLEKFISSIRNISFTAPNSQCSLEPGAIFWIDTSYNSLNTKTIGGIIGKVKLTNVDQNLFLPLVLGQYTGVGKNNSFGLGYYTIKEVPNLFPFVLSNNPFGSDFDPNRPFSSLNLRQLKSVRFPWIKNNCFQDTLELDRQYNTFSKEKKKDVLHSLFPLHHHLPPEDKKIDHTVEDLVQRKPMFLTRFVSRVRSEGEYLVIEMGDKLKIKNLWSTIGHLFLIGKPPVTTGIIYKAMQCGIPVTFMNMMGKTQGHLYPEGHDLAIYTNLQLKRQQDKDFILEFAKEIVSAKIHNSIVILRRNKQNYEELKEILNSINKVKDIDALRGYEGIAAKAYFKKFRTLIETFGFENREYHPSTDPVNSMLSFCYSLLYNRLASILRIRGLNPRLGLYHASRGRHAALASDLMEELRHVAERIVLKIIHRKEIKTDQFIYKEQKGKKYCEIPREIISLLVYRFEEVMHQNNALYSGELYYFLDKMVQRFILFLQNKAPYKAIRIR